MIRCAVTLDLKGLYTVVEQRGTLARKVLCLIGLLVVCVTPITLGHVSSHAEEGAAVQGKIEKIEKTEKQNTIAALIAPAGVVRVIARLSSAGLPPGRELTESAHAKARRGLQQEMEAINVSYIQPIGNLPFVVLEVNQQQHDRLLNSRYVEATTQDQLAPALSQGFARRSAQHFDHNLTVSNVQHVWKSGARGQGHVIAFLDTGVDRTDPVRAERIVAEACFCSFSPSLGGTSVCLQDPLSVSGEQAAQPCAVEDACSHEPTSAHIAAGYEQDFSSIAPEAQIIAVQIFSLFTDQPEGPHTCAAMGLPSPCRLAFLSDQIRGLAYVRTQAKRFPIAAVNLGAGHGHFTTNCDTDFRKRLIDQLWNEGIATIVATQHDGLSNTVSAPGCISTAVTVGATRADQGVEPASPVSLVDLFVHDETHGTDRTSTAWRKSVTL